MTVPTANGWFTILHPAAMDDLQFTSFFTDFQSYQDGRRVIIKGWCNGIPVTVGRFLSLVGFEPKTATIRQPAPNLPCKIIASLSKKFTIFQECLSLNN